MLIEPPSDPYGLYHDKTGATVTALVRTVDVILGVPKVVTRTGPVVLQTIDGVYFGDPQGNTTLLGIPFSWYARWDEVLESSIPLLGFPIGHPLD